MTIPSPLQEIGHEISTYCIARGVSQRISRCLPVPACRGSGDDHLRRLRRRAAGSRDEILLRAFHESSSKRQDPAGLADQLRQAPGDGGGRQCYVGLGRRWTRLRTQPAAHQTVGKDRLQRCSLLAPPAGQIPNEWISDRRKHVGNRAVLSYRQVSGGKGTAELGGLLRRSEIPWRAHCPEDSR